MATSLKFPQPGEWWLQKIDNGDRATIIGVANLFEQKNAKMVVYTDKNGHMIARRLGTFLINFQRV